MCPDSRRYVGILYLCGTEGQDLGQPLEHVQEKRVDLSGDLLSRVKSQESRVKSQESRVKTRDSRPFLLTGRRRQRVPC